MDKLKKNNDIGKTYPMKCDLNVLEDFRKSLVQLMNSRDSCSELDSRKMKKASSYIQKTETIRCILLSHQSKQSRQPFLS